MRSSRSRRSHTSEPIVVRRATVADARRILEVRARSWQVAYAQIFSEEDLERLSATSADWVSWWEEAIGSREPGVQVVVVERDGGLAGFAYCGPARGEQEEGLGELYAIYVDPPAWGAGIGRALMEETLASLRAAGFEEAVLWVLEENPRARRFYELAGWSVDGGVKVEEWLGAHVREVRYRTDLGTAA